MSFIQDNQELIRALSNDRKVIDQLLDTAKHQRPKDLVGRSDYSFPPGKNQYTFKRGFFTGRIEFNGIPLGVKLGENRFPSIELAGISYLHAWCDNLAEQKLLPRLFGTINKNVLGTSYPIIIMEDFSEGGTREIDSTRYQHQCLITLCKERMPVEQTTFAAIGTQDTRYPLGDFDGLQGLLETPHDKMVLRLVKDIVKTPGSLEIV
jgi:hypothetical protein